MTYDTNDSNLDSVKNIYQKNGAIKRGAIFEISKKRYLSVTRNNMGHQTYVWIKTFRLIKRGQISFRFLERSSQSL